MRLAIIGAGPIGLGTAMLLQRRGHEAVLWSPSGSIDSRQHAQMHASGALEGVFQLAIAENLAAALAGVSAVMIAVPAHHHPRIIETLAPQLTEHQVVLMWTQSSLSSLYLSKQLAERNRSTAIALWSGPLIGGRRKSDREVSVSTIRSTVDLAGLPLRSHDQVISLCTALFGPCFAGCRPVDIVFSNLNPIMHVPQMLCSLTRAEKAEPSSCLGNTTLAVSRLIDELDAERQRVAAAFGAKVITLSQHFHRSFSGVPLASVAEQAPILAAKLLRTAPPDGPRSLRTRFIDEDIPFGAVPTEMLGHVAGVATPLHRGCIDVFNILLDRDLREEFAIAPTIGLSRRTKTELTGLFENGWIS